jgi:hypothetical protein
VIQPPRRAVTRFLIPFIDVLILLFCVFLLMPFVSRPDAEGDTEPPPEIRDPALPTDVQVLQDELANLRRQLDELRRQREHLADRLSVRVLEIDKEDGRLYGFDPDGKDGRIEIRDQSEARRLINRQKYLAGEKDIFFLILYPRELTGYPLREQVETYRRWFQDVPHGFDNPWSNTAEVGK